MVRYDLLEIFLSSLPLFIAFSNIPIWFKIPFFGISLILLIDAVSGKLRIWYQAIKYILFIFEERKRLEFEVNQNISEEIKEENFPYKVKVESLLEKEKDIDAFVKTAQKKLVISLKMGKNRSLNSFRCVQKAICEGYIRDIKQYISPKLADAFDHWQIYRVLDRMNDVVALGLFIKNSKFNQFEKEITALDALDREGALDNIFIPNIRKLKIDRITTSPSIVKSIDEFFEWLSNEDIRLEKPFSTKHIPKMRFVYVREPGKSLIFHAYAIEVVFKHFDCKICILGARGRNIEVLDEVINNAKKIFGLKFKKLKDIPGKSFLNQKQISTRLIVLSKLE